MGQQTILLISLFFSLGLSSLGILLKLFLSYPVRFKFILSLKRFEFIQKFLIFSEYFYYQYFCTTKLPLFYFKLIIYSSGIIAVLGGYFRSLILPGKLLLNIDLHSWYLIFIIIIVINTIFRSFINFSSYCYKNKLFITLVEHNFFDDYFFKVPNNPYLYTLFALILSREKEEQAKRAEKENKKNDESTNN